MATLRHVTKGSAFNGSILSHLPIFGRSTNLSQSNTHFHEQETLYQQILPFKDGIAAFFSSLPHAQIIFLILCAAWALGPLIKKRPAVTGAVYHGYRSWLEPTIFVRARFIFNAKDLIASGSRTYKDRPFVLRRWDLDMTVLPNKYMKELRLFPVTKLSGVVAHIANFIPKWTYTELMVKSNVHFRVLLNKLTPEVPKHLDIAKKELEFGWAQDMPQPEEWTEVDIQEVLRMCVARMSAKIFLGEPACRNLEWLRLSIDFSIDLFACAFLLRKVPSFLHPIVAPILPLRWRVARHLKRAQVIIGPLMERHRDCVRRRAAGEEVEEEDTLLNWMMDNGTETENRLEEMASRQTILTLASIHTTSMAVSNLLFDLCANPEWFPVLREEIAEIEKDLGKLGERPEVGAKQWLPRLEKMDSAFVESLRLNPPLLLASQRQAMVPITLKDGTHIPVGTRLACAKADFVYDDPATFSIFDPMRSYRQRYQTGELTKHLAGIPEKDYLHFGYGRQACPGRYFAVGEVKMMMLKLLDEFEFRFPDGKGRPKSYHADEFTFLDPRAKLVMRRKRVACDKCGRC